MRSEFAVKLKAFDMLLGAIQHLSKSRYESSEIEQQAALDAAQLIVELPPVF